MIREKVAAEMAREEERKKIVENQKLVLMKIADVAKQKGFRLAVAPHYRRAADAVVKGNKSLYYDAVKINNINYNSDESIIFKHGGWLGGLEKILCFNHFDAGSIELMDRSYLEMAEHVEKILLDAQLSVLSVDTDNEPQEISVAKYWRCPYCNTVNDELKCNRCGAPRK